MRRHPVLCFSYFQCDINVVSLELPLNIFNVSAYISLNLQNSYCGYILVSWFHSAFRKFKIKSLMHCYLFGFLSQFPLVNLLTTFMLSFFFCFFFII